jgi:hypothetical protein
MSISSTMTAPLAYPGHRTSTDPAFAGRTWILQDLAWDWRHPVLMARIGDALVDILRVEVIKDWPEWIPRNRDPRSIYELRDVMDVIVGGPAGWDLIPSDVARDILDEINAAINDDT